MENTKKIAVILSGCGVFDGAEIHESVLTMLAIAKQGASYTLFAPDIIQHHVINHINGDEMNEKRNVLLEAARIARGAIQALSDFDISNFDALMLPGGFGAAKNLSSLAFEGPDCKVEAQTAKAIQNTHEAKKPIGALCIAPAVLAKVIKNINVTIGQDKGTIEAIEKMGSTHTSTDHGEVTIDRQNKIATTPCYMLDANILQIEEGASNVVKAVLELI